MIDTSISDCIEYSDKASVNVKFAYFHGYPTLF